MVSSLDDEYSVTYVATKETWYSPCVIWGRGGASGGSVGRRKVWVVDWGCVRAFYGCVFVIGI